MIQLQKVYRSINFSSKVILSIHQMLAYNQFYLISWRNILDILFVYIYTHNISSMFLLDISDKTDSVVYYIYNKIIKSSLL